MRKIVINVIRLIVSTGLLYLIFSKVEFNIFLSLIGSTDLHYLALGFIFVLSITFVISIRFSKLTNLPFKDIIVLMYKVNFFNNLLPAQIGGDLYKYSALRKYTNSRSNVLSAVLADRLLGMTGLIILAVTGLVFGNQQISDERIFIGLITYVAGLILLLIVLVYLPFINVDRINIIYIRRLVQWIYKIQKNVKIMYLRFFKIGVMYAVLSYILLILANVFVAKSLGLFVNLSASFVYIPLIAIAVVTLPVSFNGMGVREGLYVFFFGSVGCSFEESLAMATINLIFVWIISLIGGGILLVDNLQLKIKN